MKILWVLHGGAYYTLADVAGGKRLVQRNSKCVTLQADLHFSGKAHGGGDHCLWHMRAHLGKSTGVSHVEMKDSEGRSIAACTVTMFFTDEPLNNGKNKRAVCQLFLFAMVCRRHASASSSVGICFQRMHPQVITHSQMTFDLMVAFCP